MPIVDREEKPASASLFLCLQDAIVPDMIVEGNGRRHVMHLRSCWLDLHSARVSRLTETSQQCQPSNDEVGLTPARLSAILSESAIAYHLHFPLLSCHCIKRLQQRGKISGWIGYLRSCIHYILRCTTPSHRGIMRKRKAAPSQILIQFPSTSKPCDTQRKR